MGPDVITILPRDYAVSQWSGGTTTQLAIAPPGAVYADRDFLWRLSSATVDLDSSDFTPLPDYTRLISLLRGEMRLSHDGGPELSLAPYQVHAFDGGTPTRSQGRCVDFNLMLRKGRCRGSLQSLRSGQPGALALTPAVLSPEEYPRCTLAVYCGEGSAEVSAGGRSAALNAGETALIEDLDTRPAELAWHGPVSLMLAQIHF